MDGGKSDFVLRLIDRVTAPARAMQRALRSMQAAQKAATAGASEAQAALDRVGNAAARAGAQAARAAGNFKTLQYSTAAARFKAIGGRALAGSLSALGSFSVAKPMGPVFDRAQQRKYMGFWENLRIDSQSLLNWNKAAGESIEKWKGLASAFMKTPLGMPVSGLGFVGEKLLDLTKWAALATAKFTAFSFVVGGIVATAIAKTAAEMVSFAEKSKLALSYVTGAISTGGEAFTWGLDLAKELGLDAQETIQQLIKLRSMQFSVRESMDLIRISADLQAITGDAQAAERALTALTQIKAKGKLQSEELVGQLAEAGVSTVLVYEELEKIYKKNREGVLKLMQKGQIDAENGIEAIKKAILKKLNTKEAGEVGRNFAQTTLAGLWAQLKNIPKNLGISIAQFIDIKPLKDVMREVLDTVYGYDQNGLVRFVRSLINGFVEASRVVLAFGQGFGDSLWKITDALDIAGINLRDDARSAGKWLAEFFANSIELAKNLRKAIQPALEGFLRGLGINDFLRDMKSADWETIGKNLSVIAEALGKITNYTAKFVAWFGVDLATGEGGAIDRAAHLNPGRLTASQREAFDRMEPGWEKFLAGLNPLWRPSQEQLTAPAPPASAWGGRNTSVGRIEQHIYINGGDAREVTESARDGLLEALYGEPQHGMWGM